MARIRNLLMALTFGAAMAGGAVAQEATPLARIKRDVMSEEVRDAGGRTWSFTPTAAGVRRYGPSLEL